MSSQKVTIEDILEGLKDPDPILRKKCLLFLGRIEKPQIINYIAPLLHDDSEEIRSITQKFINHLTNKFDLSNSPQNYNSNGIRIYEIKCPNCGGELSISNKNKPIKCSYCNSEVIIKGEDKINVNSIEIDNLLELAKAAEKSCNYLESYKYYTKILEFDIDNINAWYGKGLSAWNLSSNETKRFKEVITCFKKISLFNSIDSGYKNKMASFLFNISKEFTSHTIKTYYSTSSLKNDKQENILLDINNAKKNFNDNYSDILTALELSWELSQDFEVGEYIIYICGEIKNTLFDYKFDNSLTIRAKNLMYRQINEIKKIRPNWESEFDIKEKLYKDFNLYNIIRLFFFYAKVIFILLIIGFIVRTIEVFVIKNDSTNKQTAIYKPIRKTATTRPLYTKKNITAVTTNDNMLHLAAKEGKIETIKTLLDRNYNINAFDDYYNCTPLHYAAENNQIEAIKLLISNNANVDAISKNYGSPLHLAVTKGYDDVVKTLVENGANVNSTNSKGETPLFIYLGTDYYIIRQKMIEFLLENKADVNVKNSEGNTLLHYASINLNKSKAIKLIADKWADMNSKNNKGNTPLHCAIIQNNYDAGKELLDNGADPNVKDNANQTPLDIALKARNEDFIKILKEHGAR